MDVKFVLDNEVRCVEVLESTIEHLATLENFIRELFCFEKSQRFFLTYLDFDCDRVTIRSDAEIATCLKRFQARGRTLKFQGHEVHEIWG